MRLKKFTFEVTCNEPAEKNASKPAKMFPQYAGACSACLAAFSVGTILGWTSPASPLLKNGDMGFKVSEYEISLIGGLMPIGAAFSCVPTGYSTDKFGRKYTLIALVPLFLLGWALTIWANSVQLLYAGRFVCGLCAGAVCVVAPVFSAEICQKEVRGILGTFYQLLLASGIMFIYIIGSQMSVFWFSVVCAVFPIIFGISFTFFPDTPVYYLMKGQPEKARAALQFFRGPEYDVEPELCELAEGCHKKIDSNESTLASFTSKQAIKSTVLSVGMMIFQQLSGVNAVIFYTTFIFQAAGSSLKAEYSTVLIGLMEVVSTASVMFVIDRLGRRLLLVSSCFVMFICLVIMGIYFHLKDNNHDVSKLGWLPLVSLCVYMIVFSVGYGPVPWAMMPEILPSKIKGSASSIACVINWLCAFLVTKYFSSMIDAFGSDVTFWIFAVICAVGTLFSFGLPETKGKSFEQIQLELAGLSKNDTPNP